MKTPVFVSLLWAIFIAFYNTAVSFFGGILLAFLLVSCFPNDNRSTNSSEPNALGTSVNQWIVANDQSVSAQTYNITEQNLEQLYTFIAQRGGGRLALLGISAKSYDQEPIIIEVPAIDTTTVGGNLFAKGRNQRHNQQELASFEKNRTRIRQLLKVDNSHHALFTDISGALQLINTLIDPNVENVHVVLSTDLVNDQPPKDGYDPMPKHLFSVPIQLHLIRPDTRITGPVDSLFSGAKVHQYAYFSQILNQIN